MAKFINITTITNVGPRKNEVTVFHTSHGVSLTTPAADAVLVDTKGSYSEIKGGSRLVADQGVFSEDAVVIYYERGQSHSYCVPAGTQWFRVSNGNAAVAGTLAYRYPGFDGRVAAHRLSKKLVQTWASI